MTGNKRITRLITTAALIAGAYTIWCISCTPEKLQSPSTMLEGTWRLVQTATDDNDNGKMDASEIFPVSDSMQELIKFNKDNSGVQDITILPDSVITDYTFSWQLPSFDTLIRYYEGHDTVRSHMDQLTKSTLTLQNVKTVTSPVINWFIYKKV